MIVGIPKEIKEDEYRVGIVPAGARALVSAGQTVLLENGAGLGSGISDLEFRQEGAEIIGTPEEIFSRSDLIIKVKEPHPDEYDLLKQGQILYTFLHLAPAPELTKVLLKRKIIGIAYETVQLDDGTLPLLTPMSEVAGKMSIQEGAKYLEREKGGRGILLGGVPGVERGNVVIIGCGTAGMNAAKVAVGMGANVTLLDINLERLRYIDDIFSGRVNTLMSNSHTILKSVAEADLVIGAVLIPGDRAPRLITKEMIRHMKQGSVVVDVCIDQGGCIETSKPTSHSNPIFTVGGVIHYCVTNMPGALSRTSTFALTNATLRYAVEIATRGCRQAIEGNPAIKRGLNIAYGKITHRAVADALNAKYHSPEAVMKKLRS